MKIALQTLASAVGGLVYFGVLLFLPAGSVHYWQGWVYIAVFTVVTMVPSSYLAVRHPAALRRRMKAGPTAETRPIQKVVMVGTVASVALVLAFSAVDHRFGWSSVPIAVVVVGNVLVAVGLALTQLVIIQNNYAAATITVEADQPLVSTGLYGLVRHPMYFGALIMMVGTPLALGSYWGLLLVPVAIPLLVLRIVDEERLLTEQLPGYRDYTRDVRHRLLPYVW